MLYQVRTILAVVAARMRTRGTARPEDTEKYVKLAELRPFDNSPVYLAYHPDQLTAWGKYSEFARLQDRFLRANLRNNCGDLTRLWSLILNIHDVVERNIPGDFAELGVWRGNTAAVLAHFAEGRKVHLFDTFEGFDSRDLVGVDATQKVQFSDTSLELVRENIADQFDSCVYVKGRFPESVGPEQSSARYAVVSLDCDLQEPMSAALSFFYPRMNEGGVIFIHDYDNSFWPGIKMAVDTFCTEHRLFPIRLPDKSGSAVLRKSAA